MADDAGQIVRFAWRFLENLFETRRRPTDNEALSLASNTRLLKAADESDELRSILGKFGEHLKHFVDAADQKKLEGLAKKLASPRVEVRLKALDEFYSALEKTINLADASTLKNLVDRAVRDIGADALRAIPQFEFGFRRYLAWKRKGNPNFTATFSDYLNNSKSTKLRLVLKAMLASDQLKVILWARRTYKPADGNIQLAQGVADAIKSSLSDAFSKLPSSVVVDLLFKKLGPIKEFELESGAIFWRLKKTLLVKVVEVDRLIEFPRGYLQNLQGNLGELIAMAFKARRFEELRKARGDTVYLFQDVRVNGKRIVPDKKDPRFKLDDDAPDRLPGEIPDEDLRDLEPPSVPAPEKDISGTEFSDDFLVDLADPKRPQFLEQFESKVTRRSLEDGHDQIARNIEVMSQTSEVTVGRVLKLDKNGNWVEVPLSEVKGAQIITGKDGVQRLIFKENEEWLEKADDLMEELANKIRQTRKDMPRGPERDEAIAALIREYDSQLPKRSLQGLVNSKKYLTVPKDHMKDGILPDNVEAIPFKLGELDVTYKQIVDFCNVLMLRSVWHQLFD